MAFGDVIHQKFRWNWHFRDVSFVWVGLVMVLWLLVFLFNFCLVVGFGSLMFGVLHFGVCYSLVLGFVSLVGLVLV